jgi:hypothetical protein
MTRIQIARALRLGFVLAAAMLAVACGGSVDPGEPAPITCESAWAECSAVCGAELSCRATCDGSLGACSRAHALSCSRVESAPHACASSGCWATLACNRDPSEEMGLTCTPAEGAWACKW